MKFDRLLKIYWSKGLFFNGRLVKADWSLRTMFSVLDGFSEKTKTLFIKRFECTYLRNPTKTFYLSKLDRSHKWLLNTYFAQSLNTSYHISDMVRYNLIRLYLIKTFRGRCQALGKPSRGQRTWSNAWTSYKYNLAIRHFVNEIIKNRKTKAKPTKINYKVVKRKLRKKSTLFKIKPTVVKTNTWF